MKNILLGARTVGDIDAQVAKILRGLGNPEPPLDLATVRDLLKLDRAYYSTTDDSVLRDVFSRIKVAGRQVVMRPGIIADVVRKLSLKALYLPDQKRILLDASLPKLKHRWNEAHEIGHDIIPWHAGMMIGDTEQTLTPTCHEKMESEANYAAGRLLFVADRFAQEANSSPVSLGHVFSLGKKFGNTKTSTLWRFIEQAHSSVPLVGLVTSHPHRARRPSDFNPASPCRYFVRSPSFSTRFGHLTDVNLFLVVAGYCGSQRGGPLGQSQTLLADINGDKHVFHFETFFNGHEALTLGRWLQPHTFAVQV